MARNSFAYILNYILSAVSSTDKLVRGNDGGTTVVAAGGGLQRHLVGVVTDGH